MLSIIMLHVTATLHSFCFGFGVYSLVLASVNHFHIFLPEAGLVLAEVGVVLLLPVLQLDRDVGVEVRQLPGEHLVPEAVEAVPEVPPRRALQDADPLLVDGLLLVPDHRVPRDLLAVPRDLTCMEILYFWGHVFVTWQNII